MFATGSGSSGLLVVPRNRPCDVNHSEYRYRGLDVSRKPICLLLAHAVAPGLPVRCHLNAPLETSARGHLGAARSMVGPVGDQFDASAVGIKQIALPPASTDGGKSWEAARFSRLGPPAPLPYAWVHWEYNWKIPGPGSYELACRATDESGLVQPAKRPSDRVDDYELNTWQIVRVSAV